MGETNHILVAGSGPSGAYLAYLLRNRPNTIVDIYDLKESNELGNKCAWGVCFNKLNELLPKFNYGNDFILHEGETLHLLFDDSEVEVPIQDLITMNKNKLIQQLVERSEATPYFGQDATEEDPEDYDLIVDATGPFRAFLGTNEDDFILPTYQVIARPYKNDFFLKTMGVGYIWGFPLGDDLIKVGCGHDHYNPKKVVMDYVEKMGLEIVNEEGAVIRMTPPSKTENKYKFTPSDTPIVGIGESIGTVSPISGEGIVPSMKSAQILVDALNKNGSHGILPTTKSWWESVLSHYEHRVDEEFAHLNQEYKVIKSIQATKTLKTLWNGAKLPEREEFDMGWLTKIKSLVKSISKVKEYKS